MENTIFNLSKNTKTVLRNMLFGFVLWFLSYWCLRACHNAPSQSVMEVFWGFSGFGLIIGVIAVIICTIVSICE